MSIVNTLKEMFTSKKFVAAVAGTIVAYASKIGLELPTEEVAVVVLPIVSYIIGQGWADIGKEKAKIEKKS